VQDVQPNELLARVQALPAAGPLLARLGPASGVFLVGGAVRDILLGGDPSELDLVVEGDADQVVSRLGGDARNHERFGTSSVELDGFRYDIAVARRETYARPGALPEVTPASLAEDLARRDFTVNTGAIALGPPLPGELRAAPGAIEDLDARRLRVLHQRSFEDDPTRLMRLARYASRLRFEIEPATLELAQHAVAQGALTTISGARLGAELRLLAREPDPVVALGALRELELDRAIQPHFGLDDPELARRALGLLPADGEPELLVLSVAARRVPRADLAALLDALAFDRGARETILDAATRAHLLAAALSDAASDSDVAAALAGARPELAAFAGALGPDAKAAKWLQRLRHVRLEIDGEDLLAAGVVQGPLIGRALAAALAAKLDGQAPDRAAELEQALRAAGSTR
jgi:tRNA nucleotidyltransferase (CCA-adding enzyme)